MFMLLNILVIIFGTLTSTCFADCSVSRCNWGSWEPWGDCSRKCGGTRSRSRSLCCKADLVSHDTACYKDCNKSPDGHIDQDRCGNYCYNGGTSVVGKSENDCRCTDNYYGVCCSHECPTIRRCIKRHCTSRSNTRCYKCEDDNVFFKRTQSNTKCKRMCAWNNHYCWPGNCSGGLTNNCQCDTGFIRISKAGETSCQLSKKPSIVTCDTVVHGPKGEKKQAKSRTRSKACQYLHDVYGNFQPASVQFKMMTAFSVHIYSKMPRFIQESSFGVTNTTVHIKRRAISGQYTILTSSNQVTDWSSSIKAQRTSNSSGRIDTSASKFAVSNGEAFCLAYEAWGGGYLKYKDLSNLSRAISEPVPYQKTTTTSEVCYIFDNAPPVHCLELGHCSYDPLQMEHKITRSEILQVNFRGWTDPIPNGGTARHASGVESYQITVNLVIPSRHNAKVNVLNTIFTTKLNEITVTSLSLNLTSNTPKLYCVTLAVQDVADNVKQARRFVLYDKTSYIETRTDKSFIVTSASTETNFTWQTHHNDICLDWKEYFYNTFYVDNTVLNPIEPDVHGLINGVYEQTRGQLPVSGTPNVHGIIQYMFSWSLNDGPLSNKLPVPNFLNQRFCHHFDVKDGETYILNIQPIDIVNNTRAESRTVHIDESVPHIYNISIMKGGHKTSYVRYSDLSETNLHFEVLDEHSGIRSIIWTFGISDSGTELATETMAAGKIKENECPPCVKECYCPDVGFCEMFNYTIPLNKLVPKSNLGYFFTVTVTNHALLSNTEHLDVFVDNSASVDGAGFEGMCAWNNHYCWPGNCSGGLTNNCQCDTGFIRISKAGETSCQLSQKPSIVTCDTVVHGPKGEKKRAKSRTRSKACQYLHDVYGNFQPASVQFKMMTEFSVHIYSKRPRFIQESSFGVTNTTVHIKRRAISGQYTILTSSNQVTDWCSSIKAQRTSHSSGRIDTSASKFAVSNGEAFCLAYEAWGGGYLKYNDLSNLSRAISEPVPYQKTTTTSEVCYIFDNAPPVHCLELGHCSYDPLQMEHKITRSEILQVNFRGWTDPIPNGGTAKHASGVESYQITVNLVIPSRHNAKVNVLNTIFTTKLNEITVTSLSLNLTSYTPKLYCVTLAVQDVADNVKQARRFVLYDKTSYIETRTDKSVIVTSASTETNFTWQTHHNDICLDWKEYFYNTFYVDNTVLNPIEPDVHGLINGVYEQTRGQLPVSGTPNVHGIIQYMFSWSLNDGPLSNKLPVPNFLNQRFCHHFDVKDGETYILNIQPIDIVNNTRAESRTVHIDESVPHIYNICIMKGGHKTSYVRYSDLSKTNLHFEVLDEHSGIRSIIWTFGISDSGTELATETMAAGKIKENECPPSFKECYCPDVGFCEMFNYTIPLNKLVPNSTLGYFFTVTVTNHALLSNTEHLDVFVDNSASVDGAGFEATPLDLYAGIGIGCALACIVLWTTIICVIWNMRQEGKSPQQDTIRQPKTQQDDGGYASIELGTNRTALNSESVCDNVSDTLQSNTSL